MKQSFYHYLMTKRSPKHDVVSQFADDVFKDVAFPKQVIDYETLSHYLELHVDYLKNMDVFDTLYEEYLENNC